MFRAPAQITTDHGSQFVNELFTHLTERLGVDHHKSTPYSKEENGLVERANKEVNRFLRNLEFDKGIKDQWSAYLPTIMMFMNNSVKRSLGVSPNTLMFGGTMDHVGSVLQKINHDVNTSTPSTVRTYIDELMDRYNKIIAYAASQQNAYNTETLEARNEPAAPKKRSTKKRKGAPPDTSIPDSDIIMPTYGSMRLRYRKPKPKSLDDGEDDHTMYINNSKLYNPTYESLKERYKSELPNTMCIQNISIIRNPLAWIRVDSPDNPEEYQWIRRDKVHVLNIPSPPPTTIAKPPKARELTRYVVGDYVLRKYPAMTINDRFCSFWRGPYIVTKTEWPTNWQPSADITQIHEAYTIRNLVTNVESQVTVKDLRPFYYDPRVTTPINIAIKDPAYQDFHIVAGIVDHRSSGNTHQFKIRWEGFTEADDTWSDVKPIRLVEKFHAYCRQHAGLAKYIPKSFRQEI